MIDLDTQLLEILSAAQLDSETLPSLERALPVCEMDDAYFEAWITGVSVSHVWFDEVAGVPVETWLRAGDFTAAADPARG